MSEYWKSTVSLYGIHSISPLTSLQPKYWCKHCKTHVRDTKLERSQHEATPKHQGNLKRFLRDLHRDHEREEREKQRAKDEVARLNGLSKGSSNAASSPGARTSPYASTQVSKDASAVERKQQLSQLASMGIAIPDEYRGEMAMAGDWQTLSQQPTKGRLNVAADEDVKPDTLNIGVRKRRHEEYEEEGEASERVVRKGWGSTTKRYPGSAGGDLDLDALLRDTKVLKREKDRITQDPKAEEAAEEPSIKREDSTASTSNVPNTTLALDEPPAVKLETSGNIKEDAVEGPSTDVVFKKRKSKPLRNR